ncbi:RnfH family protein [Acidihalobacter prosperus]
MVLAPKLRVEVVYAKPERQLLQLLNMPEGATVEQAIQRSGILKKFPEIDLSNCKIGIFGKICHLSRQLSDGDRIEVYRSLKVDPKEKRRYRARKAR